MMKGSDDDEMRYALARTLSFAGLALSCWGALSWLAPPWGHLLAVGLGLLWLIFFGWSGILAALLGWRPN